MEIVKRLRPTKDVLRQLYLKSGNRCAYPSCERNILNEVGDFVGQVCHIEAAMPGGERFNLNQTNEERRSESNLLIMCHEHHVKTDNVKVYSVERLKKMKERHEKIFGGISEKLYKSIKDPTKAQNFHYCRKLNGINSILGWDNTESELLETVPHFNALLDTLRELPPNTREVLCIMIERSTELEVIISLITELIGERDFKKHHTILQNYKLVSSVAENWSGILICDIQEIYGWPILGDIKLFSQKTTFSLSQIINDLDFSVFDEEINIR